MNISPAGQYLIVNGSDSTSSSYLFDVARGTALPLEGAASRDYHELRNSTEARPVCLSAKTSEKIWDTDTGKIVMKWGRDRKDGERYRDRDGEAGLDPTGGVAHGGRRGDRAPGCRPPGQLLATLRRAGSRVVDVRSTTTVGSSSTTRMTATSHSCARVTTRSSPP